ncbi:MAG: hypothetical protein ACKON9_26090, partial [Planctomycetaceae bacterium]
TLLRLLPAAEPVPPQLKNVASPLLATPWQKCCQQCCLGATPHNKQHNRLAAHKTANDKTEMPAQIAGQDGQIVADLQIATASPQLMISATELTIN